MIKLLLLFPLHSDRRPISQLKSTSLKVILLYLFSQVPSESQTCSTVEQLSKQLTNVFLIQQNDIPYVLNKNKDTEYIAAEYCTVILL